MEDFVDKFEEWEDEELTRWWNYLETCKGGFVREQTMDDIEASLSYRRVEAWDADGKITQRG